MRSMLACQKVARMLAVKHFFILNEEDPKDSFKNSNRVSEAVEFDF